MRSVLKDIWKEWGRENNSKSRKGWRLLVLVSERRL